jgi:hypothetical protein
MTTLNELAGTYPTSVSGVVLDPKECGYLVNSIPGTAGANACLSVDASKDVSGIRNINSKNVIGNTSVVANKYQITNVPIFNFSNNILSNLTLNNPVISSLNTATSSAIEKSTINPIDTTSTIPTSEVVTIYATNYSATKFNAIEISDHGIPGVSKGLYNYYASSTSNIYIYFEELVLVDQNYSTIVVRSTGHPTPTVQFDPSVLATARTGGNPNGYLGSLSSDTWYYVWVCYNTATPNTFNAVLHNSEQYHIVQGTFTTNGYTHWARVGMVRMGNPNFIPYILYDNKYTFNRPALVSNYSSSSINTWVSLNGTNLDVPNGSMLLPSGLIESVGVLIGSNFGPIGIRRSANDRCAFLNHSMSTTLASNFDWFLPIGVNHTLNAEITVYANQTASATLFQVYSGGPWNLYVLGFTLQL